MKIVLTERQLKLIVEQQKREDFPPCVQVFGEPELMGSSYVIKGTGDWEGYNFNSTYFYDPTTKKNDNRYFCKGNKIVVGQLSDVSSGKLPGVTEQDNDWNIIKDGKKLIKIGSKGPLVKSLQAILQNLTGINSGGPGCIDLLQYASCDGKFGNGTRNAVIEFQKQSGIKKPDGIVGKQLFQILFSMPDIQDMVRKSQKIMAGFNNNSSTSEKEYNPTNYEKYQQTQFYRGPGGGI